MLTPPYLSPRRHPAFAERDVWNVSSRLDHSGFAPANFTTLPHFSVSSAMSLPKSAGEPGSAVAPHSASRAFVLGSARAALISVLSLSTIGSCQIGYWQRAARD